MKRSLVLGVALAVLWAAPASAGHPRGSHPWRGKRGPGSSVGRDTVTLFLHGVNTGADTNCQGTFGRMRKTLRGFGQTGSLVTLRYYFKDKDCSHSISHHRAHHRHFGSGHRRGGHTGRTDIRHLGFHLAWYIYKHWTAEGIPVQIVGHSMGGLISRYALARVERGHRRFPSFLLVEDVVTMGTPHSGSNDIEPFSDWFCDKDRFLQCRQMSHRTKAGYRLLLWLHRHARHPDPFGMQTTDWTNIGSYDDEAVTVHSATAMNGDHRVLYHGGNSIHHSYYMYDGSDFRDRDVWWKDRGREYYAWRDGPHVIRWVDFALSSHTW